MYKYNKIDFVSKFCLLNCVSAIHLNSDKLIATHFMLSAIKEDNHWF